MNISNDPTTPSNTINTNKLEQETKIEVDQTSISTDNREMKKKSKLFITLVIVAVLAGVATGFGSFKLKAKNTSINNTQTTTELPVANQVKVGDIFGSHDESFKDSAEGYLEAGGLDGEGSHKLLRPGGVSQTVYLTSSVTDLDELVGNEVKVWGETFKGQKAGWLMDVGRVEVLELNAQAPIEE